MKNWKRWYQVLFLFVLFHVLYFGGQYLAELPAARNETSPRGILQVTGVFAILLIFFGGYAWYIEHHVKVAPRYSLGQHVKHLLSSICIGLFLMLALNMILQLILQFLHVTTETSQNQAGINQMIELNTMSKLVTLVLVVFVAPLCEEVIYRLLLIGPVQTNKVRPTQAHRKKMAILSWICFILAHMGQQIVQVSLNFSWSGMLGVITAALSYGILSFVLVREYYLHGSLARSLAVHMSWNLLAASVLFLL